MVLSDKRINGEAEPIIKFIICIRIHIKTIKIYRLRWAKYAMRMEDEIFFKS